MVLCHILAHVKTLASHATQSCFDDQSLVEPVVLFPYSLAQTPQSMCTTPSVYQALVEVHEGSITLKYMQYVLGVELAIEFLFQFETPWY